MLKVCLSELPAKLADAVRETLPMMDIDEDNSGIRILTEQADGLRMHFAADGSLIIGYDKPYKFFRGIGYIRHIAGNKNQINEDLNADCLCYLLSDAVNMATAKKQGRAVARPCFCIILLRRPLR